MSNLALASGIVVLINLPFGYWRAGLVPKSPRWFVAIHAPVPLVVATRLLLGVGLAWRTFPVLVASFFLGQWLGGRARQARTRPR
ncbi:MAG: hypothetical protein R3D98_15435 [Candidatus Krumholzibacteriia bacterium]